MPASPGLQVGHSNQRWNGWYTHLHCVDINGVLCPPEFNGANPPTIIPFNFGTPYQVIRYDSTGHNIQDSTGSDNPANGPTRWPSGLNVVGDAGYLQKTVGAGGVSANTLVDYDSSSNAITSAVSSLAVHGIANFTTAAGGSVPIAVWGSHNVLVDNQTTVNDHACPSLTTPGYATDTGSSAVPTTCDDLGTFQSVNTGAGTLAVLEMPSPVSLSASSAHNVCAFANRVAYFASPGNTVSCDQFVTDDGLGNLTMKSAGFTDVTLAGFFYQVQGTQPTLSVAHSIYVSPPVTVASTFGLNWPASLPTNGNCVSWSVSGSIAQWVDAGAPCGSGSSGGVLIKTTNYTIQNTDTGKLIVFNCSSACTATLPASPSSTFNVGLESIGSTVATISLNGLNYNGNSAVPVFNSYRIIPAWSDGIGYYGHAPLIAGTNMTFTPAPNGMTLNSGSAIAQASNPSAPALATIGSAGSTSRTYAVVGCEDVSCTYHSAISATATIATSNATLSSSNAVTLKTYADTLYGYRYYIICRTASAGTPSTTGIIATGAGKQFLDSGLAGDGSNCASTYASNNTILDQHCLAAALPVGINVMPGAPCGVDAPPTSPNALDGENAEQFGAPGDVNNIVWSWGGGGTSACTQGSATASWSSGYLVLNTDTTTQLNCLVLNAALPTAPYTFEAWFSNITLANNATGEICLLGLRESSTGKIAAVAINPGQTVTSTTGAGGYMFQVQNWTSNTAVSAPTYYAYEPGFAYVKIQNDGSSHIVYTFSHDGISFKQWSSQTITVPFTTAPDQLIIGGSGKAGQVATCDFDFIRRTQ